MNKCNETNSKEYKVYLVPKNELEQSKLIKQYWLEHIEKYELNPFKATVTIMDDFGNKCVFDTMEYRAMNIFNKFKQKKFTLKEFLEDLEK
jgi:hypothetical protein